MLDILLENGQVHDGTGSPWRHASVGIRNGRITAVGLVKERARRVISAARCVVCPGFVDVHTHADGIVKRPGADNFLRQGVTTVVSGNCGSSGFPVRRLLAQVEKARPAINFATLVGHGEIRKRVLGLSRRRPGRAELAEMRRLAERAMRDGALGISTGLFYVPGAYARTRELVEVSRAIAAWGGIYASHKRSAGGKVFEALAEAATIGRRARIPVQISHLKVLHRRGRTGKNRIDEVLAAIERYRDAGVEMTCDVHPYAATCTTLSSLAIPPRVSEGGARRERLRDPAFRRRIRREVLGNIAWVGGPDRITIVDCPGNRSLEGRSLLSIALARKAGAAETAMDLVAEGEPVCVFHALRPGDVSRVLVSPLSMIASDGDLVVSPRGMPHPRSLGTFPRVIREYVRERKLLTLPDAIRRMTSFPARKFGIPERGVLAPGMKADVVVFDPKRIADRATFEKPRAYPVGIRAVIVNGQIAWNGRSISRRRAGEVIRSPA